MPLNFTQNQDISSREITEHDWEVDMFERQAAHSIKIKELDIEAAKLEARVSAWFRLPLYLLKLPVLLLCIIPLTVYAARKQEVPEQLWALLR